jgi:signal transduction histidine kinase/DNA-binding response OmpR family regulator/CHASE3 domain sensor protein
MLKTKLYWRVLANFAFLLIILTAMTLLTLYLLAEIEKNFGSTSSEIRTLTNVESVRHVLADAPDDANLYLITGDESAKASYENAIKEFDDAISVADNNMNDSLLISSFAEVRVLTYKWIGEIGDKKIKLGNERKAGTNIDAEMASLANEEVKAQYLTQARLLVRDMSKQLSMSQQHSLDRATGLGKGLATFIGLVNILLAVFAVALGFVLTRSITNPVSILKEGTQNIMAGKFDPINLNRSDELGQLAADFNKMSTMLGNNYTRLNAYSELVTALNAYADINTIQHRSLQLLCHHAKATVGALYLMNEEKNILELSAGYALSEKGTNVKVFAMGEGIPGQCAAEQRVLEVKNIPILSGFSVDTGLVEVAPYSVLAVPILFQDKVLGVLLLGSMNRFDELQKEIINNSVPQLGVAITNARNFEASQKLTREVARKNDELNSKNMELEKAYRVKSDFLASMSHELRTPLNSIIGFSSVLLGPNSDPLTPDQHMALEKVLRNGKNLLQLINDILDFSKLESGRMSINVEMDDAANIVANSIMAVEGMLKGKEIVLKQNIGPNLRALQTDSLKVRQILVNLLSNATKFTEKGEILVTVVQKNGMVSFSVKDSGIGIEPKNFSKVFEEFQQIDNSNTRKYKGTGLGLPISRRLALILGGDLTVESEIGKGSTFTLTIPSVFPEEMREKLEKTVPPMRSNPVAPLPALPKLVAPTAAPHPVQAVVGTGTRVLCIDDDPDVIEILTKYLVPEGYSVIGANSGDEGIKLALEHPPALITLDIMMPQKDGWQVLRELKANDTLKDIPVIIHSIIDNKPLAISLGAIDVIAKPAEPKRLLSLVQRASGSGEHFVLVVDDNEDFTLAVKGLLQTEGFKVEIANTGAKAFEILSSSTPSIIFLDLVMPQMDGFEVIQRLQRDETWKKIPVVVLTGQELTSEEWEKLNAYAKDFVKKGELTQETLSNTIKQILHKA